MLKLKSITKLTLSCIYKWCCVSFLEDKNTNNLCLIINGWFAYPSQKDKNATSSAPLFLIHYYYERVISLSKTPKHFLGSSSKREIGAATQAVPNVIKPFLFSKPSPSMFKITLPFGPTSHCPLGPHSMYCLHYSQCFHRLQLVLHPHLGQTPLPDSPLHRQFPCHIREFGLTSSLSLWSTELFRSICSLLPLALSIFIWLQNLWGV